MENIHAFLDLQSHVHIYSKWELLNSLGTDQLRKHPKGTPFILANVTQQWYDLLYRIFSEVFDIYPWNASRTLPPFGDKKKMSLGIASSPIDTSNQERNEPRFPTPQ